MRLHLVAVLAGAVLAAGTGWDSLGPFGGSATVVLVDGQQPGTVLAATSNAQIFQSRDNGDSWKALPFPAQLRATLHTLVVDPQQAGVYLAGLSSENSAYSGLMRTSDSGVTWQRVGDFGSVWSIAIWPRDSRIIAVGTEDAIWLSQDGGETWARHTAADLRPVVSLAFDSRESNILYAGTPHRAWKTSDGGANWHPIHGGMMQDSDVFSILVDGQRRRRIFAATCGGIYRSLDGGAAWMKLAEAKGASFRTYYIAQDPVQRNVLLAGTRKGLVKSVDGGATWRRLSTHTTRWIAFDPSRSNRIFVATEDAGLFRSDDLGESLQEINQGFSNRRGTSLTAFDNSLYVTLQNSNGTSLLRRTESGDAWEEVPGPPQLSKQRVWRIVSTGPQGLYLLTTDGLLVSFDGTGRWAEESAPLPESPLKLKSPFHAWPGGEAWTARATEAPVKYAAFGNLNDRVPLPFAGSVEIHDVVTTENHSLLAATSRGLVRSDDAGLRWSSVPGALEGSTVQAICRHPKNARTLFVSVYGGIYASKDSGRSWAPIGVASDRPEGVSALLVLPGKPDRLLALSRSRGIYVTNLAPE